MQPIILAVTDRLRDLPLRRRLSLLIAVCAGITAALCLLAVLLSGLWLQQQRARDETREIVRTLAFALQAPLAFGDKPGMNDALAQLRARPQVRAAWVYAPDGFLLARYGSGPLPGADSDGGFAWLEMQASETVRSESESIGRVVVANRLLPLWQAVGLAMLAITLASLTGLTLSVALARRIAAAITRPIEQLARTTREIAYSHDYARRLPDAGRDEIGTATQAFNEMLDEIRQRGDGLVEANRELEARVAERTGSLQREKERAEAASQAKSRFLANMSHELRTPLHAVIGAAQLLESGRDDPDEQARLVGAIRDRGANLLGLIDNILDLSRIESGALELVPEDFDLIDCAESALATAAVAARLKGLEVACIVDPALPVWRHGDPLRLRQVLVNLLGNAVKFTTAGEVVLRIERGAGPQGLRLHVRDTGIGIGEASKAQVFEAFRQADDGANRRFGGTGLGLAISRQLVELMGGRIVLDSELGRGSCFSIEFELPPARTARAEDPPEPAAALIFEPQDSSAAALTALLQRLGCSVTRCRTPRELRERLAARSAGARAPWVFVAVDAAETWGFLEEAIAWADLARVVGLSNGETPAAEAARKRFAVPRGLVKPVLRPALRARIAGEAVLGRAVAAGAGVPEWGGPVAPNAKHVLVVEDDPMNQMIVRGMLHNAGYRTSLAPDGASALAMIGRQTFDVVLMDWQMPDMDGLEVTRRLRSGEVGRFATVVPVIALTANAFAEDRAACLAAGMNDFLTKPVLSSSLVAAVQRWTHRPGGDDESVQGSAFAPLL